MRAFIDFPVSKNIEDYQNSLYFFYTRFASNLNRAAILCSLYWVPIILYNLQTRGRPQSETIRSIAVDVNDGDVVCVRGWSRRRVADAVTAASTFIVFTGVKIFDEFRSNPRFSNPFTSEVVAAVLGIFHILNRSKKKKKAICPSPFHPAIVLVPLSLLLVILRPRRPYYYSLFTGSSRIIVDP